MTMNYKQEIQTLSTAINELSSRRSVLVDEWQAVCEHPDVEHTEVYHSGGYDYSATTTHMYVCKDCRKWSAVEENHNSGFE